MSIKSRIKGFVGELMGSGAAKLFLDKNIYHSVNNVTIETSNGTTQIDHVIVSRYGIFVVEAKNMNGWIFGGEKQAQWTQSLPGGRKYRFQNPLRQNYRHIKSLMEFLDLQEDRFHSLVMFWGESTFKTDMPENVMDKAYSSYIKSKQDVVFTDSEVDKLVHALETGRLPSGLIKGWSTHRTHMASLEKRQNSTTICPKCGGSLVERVAMKGKHAGSKFLGCSSYPKCRYNAPLP